MISILMPIYNGVEFIDESVSSVLNQTFTEWELLIGVNGHLENSDVYKIAKSYENKSSQIRVFDFFEIKGKSETLNKMLDYCSFDYVALLDVDDIWLPEKLNVQKEYLNKYDVIGTFCVYFGDIEGIIPEIPCGDISNHDFFTVNPIINSSSIIRKSLCFWKKEYDGVEDYDLWLRLRNQNKLFYNVNEPLVKHRICKNSAFNAKGNNLMVGNLLNFHRENWNH